MKESCKDIAEILVDYADGQVSGEQSGRAAEHLAGCSDCRRLLQGLRRSLELAEVIWEDGLQEAQAVRMTAAPAKPRRRRWPRYAAAAALVISATAITWRTMNGPSQEQPTFAEIERKITEAGTAARLLAAADLLGGYSESEAIIGQQYRRIVETYPDTPAASKAKLRVE